MKTKPLPPLNPQTREPMKAEDLYPIFARECSDQELNMTDRWIPIPDEVREMYKVLPLHPACARLRSGESPRHIGTYIFQKRKRVAYGFP